MRVIQFLIMSIFVVCLVACGNSLTNVEIDRSESIELQILEADSPADRVLSLGYALAHGFNDIHIESNRYYRVAREVIYIEPSTEESKPRYLVTQSPINSLFDRIKLKSVFSKFQISVFDRNTGSIILRWASPTSGWPGDKTAKKLAKLFKVSKNPDLNTVAVNEDAMVKLTVTNSLIKLSSAELKVMYKEDSCSGKVTVTSGSELDTNSTLVATDWQFRLPKNFRGITCNENGIFISAAWQPEDLDLIWLDHSGKLKHSSYVRAERTKLGGGYYPSKLISAELQGTNLIVHRAFFKNISKANEWAIDKELEYLIPLNNSNKSKHAEL